MEPLKHECGVALIRLLKPLEYYQEKYGTWMYGLNKLYLLMEKQHNRGKMFSSKIFRIFRKRLVWLVSSYRQTQVKNICFASAD
jgi:hypothetical protein